MVWIIKIEPKIFYCTIQFKYLNCTKGVSKLVTSFAKKIVIGGKNKSYNIKDRKIERKKKKLPPSPTYTHKKRSIH